MSSPSQTGLAVRSFSVSLSRTGLVALTWGFTGAGIALTVGRYIIRKRTLGSLDWDDLTHGLALIMLIGYVSTYTAAFPRDYAIESWAASGMGPRPSEHEFDLYFRSVVGVTLQFWVCIYLVKLSFLLSYRRLFSVSHNFMKAWWAVSIFTLITFLACFLATLWSCETPGQLFVVEVCMSDVATSRAFMFVKMWCALNVASALSIMALPLWMLRTLQMRTSQKAGLGALFMLALIDIIFDIIRTIHTVNGGATAYDTLWDILEPNIAVMISCLPTYYAIFKHHRQRQADPYMDLESGSKNTVGPNNREDHELRSIARESNPRIDNENVPSVPRTEASVGTNKKATDEIQLV